MIWVWSITLPKVNDIYCIGAFFRDRGFLSTTFNPHFTAPPSTLVFLLWKFYSTSNWNLGRSFPEGIFFWNVESNASGRHWWNEPEWHNQGWRRHGSRRIWRLPPFGSFHSKGNKQQYILQLLTVYYSSRA